MNFVLMLLQTLDNLTEEDQRIIAEKLGKAFGTAVYNSDVKVDDYLLTDVIAPFVKNLINSSVDQINSLVVAGAVGNPANPQ